MLKKISAVLCAVMFTFSYAAQAEPISAITVQGAYADFGEHTPHKSSAAFVTTTLNYPLLWNIKPVVGVGGFAVGNIYGFAGVERAFAWRNFSLIPLVGAGAYHRFSSKGDLGSTLQFRQELTLAYKITPSIALGASAGHMSNAGTRHPNPGVNTFGVVLRHELPSF